MDTEKQISHVALEQNKPSADFWLRLDNAAKIYPAIQTDEMTAVFRLSVVLRERVKIKAFLAAVQMLEHRFPYYKMKPRKGFFWYYLQYYDEQIIPRPDEGRPCRSFGTNDLLFRVLVRGNKISLEFSHILTDGSGGFEFLRSLTMTYFEKCGYSVSGTSTFLQPGDRPAEEEFEDAFARYFQMNLPAPVKTAKAFHLPFKLKPSPRFTMLSFMVRIPEIVARAKQFNVSVTVYLVSVYLYAMQAIFNKMPSGKKRRSRKIFRIQVPVNLRKMYPSRTMRNFSLFVTPEIDLRLGYYTLEEIVKTVYHKIELETDEKLISKIISRNVGAERNVVLKNTPLFIKSLILYFTYRIQGTSRYSGVITNLGKVSFQQDLDKFIDYFVFVPPPPNKTLKVNCGAIGFGDNLVLTFGNITTSNEMEREFITILTRTGIHVKVLT